MISELSTDCLVFTAEHCSLMGMRQTEIHLEESCQIRCDVQLARVWGLGTFNLW